MEQAEWFMERWEAEQDAVIGDGPNTDLDLLDACLREYAAQSDAQQFTRSLFTDPLFEVTN